MIKRKQNIDENNILKSSMNNILNEKYFRPSLIKEYQAQNVAPSTLPSNQINHSNTMGISVTNGSKSADRQQALVNAPTTAGRIYRNSQDRQEDYTQVIKNLQDKITYYLQKGYFGENQTVLTTIQKFNELLSYANGYYEGAVTTANNGLHEGVGDWMKNAYYKARYPEKNSYGVNQRITKDDSGNQFAVNGDYKGQWMTDLQQLLQDYLKIDYLHGGKTVQATKDFIEFLNVDKRTFLGMIGWDNNSKQKLQKLLRDTTIAITFLAGIGGGGSQPNVQSSPQPANNPAPVQRVQQQQQNQDLSSAFEFNSAELTQNMTQTLAQLQPGNYIIKITNAHGGNEAYNQNLYQQRANAIKQNLPQGVNVSFEYGGVNQQANDAVVNITSQTNTLAGAFGESKKYTNKKRIKENRVKKQIIRLTEADLHKVIKESVKRVLHEINDEPLSQRDIDWKGTEVYVNGIYAGCIENEDEEYGNTYEGIWTGEVFCGGQGLGNNKVYFDEEYGQTKEKLKQKITKFIEQNFEAVYKKALYYDKMYS